jgi:hypothetical protein
MRSRDFLQSKVMKPRVTYADLQWHQAYERIKALPAGTKFNVDGVEVVLDWVCGDPHPPSVWLKARIDGKLKHYICRRGDPLLVEMMQPESTR